MSGASDKHDQARFAARRRKEADRLRALLVKADRKAQAAAFAKIAADQALSRAERAFFDADLAARGAELALERHYP